jgi:hypothetical protein
MNEEQKIVGIVNGKEIELAKFIMGVHEDDTVDVIHIDGNFLDCRKHNLKVVKKQIKENN